MSKAVLVMDMPKSCDVCDLHEDSGVSCYCGAPGIGENVDDYIVCRPDWCPLRPVPEKIPLKGDVSDLQKMLEEMRVASWNACIDAIVGHSQSE